LVASVLMLSGCGAGKARYEIVKDEKVIGYATYYGSADSGCKWFSYERKPLTRDARICGDYSVVKIRD